MINFKMVFIADDIEKKWIPGPVITTTSGKEKIH